MMRQLRPDRPQEKNAHDPKFNTASLRPRGFCCAVRRDLFPPVTASWRFWVLDVNPPAFQFYPDDFVGGTVDLTAKEVGHYVRLICYQWSHNRIPSDEKKLKLICGGKPSQNVLKKFPDSRNIRLEIERKKQIQFREERSKSGHIGANKRWHSHSAAIGTATVLPMANDGSPSPSPSSISKGEGNGSLSNFAERPSWGEFWAYCQTQACLLPAEWFARDKFLAAESDNWSGKANWKSYARRCKAWWEEDGRRMVAPKRSFGKEEKPVKTLLDKEIERLERM